MKKWFIILIILGIFLLGFIELGGAKQQEEYEDIYFNISKGEPSNTFYKYKDGQNLKSSVYSSDKKNKVWYEGKEYFVGDAVSIIKDKDLDTKYKIITIDGLECNFSWDKKKGLNITDDKIDFLEGTISGVVCNWDYAIDGDLYKFENGWIIDIDPSIYYNASSEWDVGSYYGTTSNATDLYLNDSDYYQEIYEGNLVTTQSGIETGLVGLWHFDDYTGESVGDYSGVGNNGTIYKGANWTDGKLNTGLEFDGVDDYITWANDSFLPRGDNKELTVSLWFKKITDGYIMEQWDIADTNDKSWDIAVGSVVNFRMNDYGSTNGYSCVGSRSVSDGNWHHFMMVYDDSEDNIDTYIDGTIDCDGSTVYNIGPDNVNSHFSIGAKKNDDSYGSHYGGLIDEVAIWNRSLSSEEIKWIYNNQKGTYAYNGTYISGQEGSGDSSRWYFNYSDIGVSKENNITYHTRCSEDNITFTNWVMLNKTGEPYINFNGTAKYCQYMVNFTNNNTWLNTTPSVNYVNLTYVGAATYDYTRNLTIINASTPYRIQGEFASFNISYNSSSGTFISGATCNVTINGKVYNLAEDGIWYHNNTINITGLLDDVVNWGNVSCYKDANTGPQTGEGFINISTFPVCTLVKKTPVDIEANSTGTFEYIINCSDPSGINVSRTIFTRTVDGFTADGPPNWWSIRPPDNTKAQECPLCGSYFLRADGRGDGKWYDNYYAEGSPIFIENYTFAATDNTSINFQVSDDGTSAILNFSWKTEPSAFRNAVFLSRGDMEKELKKNFTIRKNNYLLVRFWDLEIIRGNTNYTACIFRNIQSVGTPQKDMLSYFCNESYNVSGTVTVPNSPNCVFINALDTTALNEITYYSRNSSYSSQCYGIFQGKLGGITASNTFYIYYKSLESGVGKGYNVRYANGTSGTNTTFKDSGVAWQTNDGGVTWTQAPFTPDIWFSSIAEGDLFEAGIYVEDKNGNNFTNFTLYIDEIGDSNFPISRPTINYYFSNSTGFDYNLNKTHSRNMIIHVDTSIDPNGVGTVNHSLYLYNSNGSYNSIIQENFYSPLDSDLNITWDTTSVSDGRYKVNVTARALDLFSDVKSFLPVDNFTIDNTGPNVTLVSPADNLLINSSITYDAVFTFNCSDIYSSVENATLYLNGVANYTETSVNESTNTSISVTLGEGNYTWSINCTDTLNNIHGAENERNLNVSPIFSVIDQVFNPNLIYSNTTAQFNGTVVISTGDLDSVWFEYNASGSYINTSNLTTYAGDVYYYELNSNNFTAYEWFDWRFCANRSSDGYYVCGVMQTTEVNPMAPYFTPSPSAQTAQAGKETNYTVSCTSDNGIQYFSNISLYSYYSRVDNTSGQFKFRPSYDEELRSPINITIECVDSISGLSSGNKTFALTISACTGGGSANGTCDLGCIQITPGCTASINKSCTFMGV